MPLGQRRYVRAAFFDVRGPAAWSRQWVYALQSLKTGGGERKAVFVQHLKALNEQFAA